jgi:hypothetical protein
MLILIEAFLLKCPEDDSLEQKLEEVTVNILGCIGPKRQILSWKRGKVWLCKYTSPELGSHDFRAVS